jgi:hypothetical protein
VCTWESVHGISRLIGCSGIDVAEAKDSLGEANWMLGSDEF